MYKIRSGRKNLRAENIKEQMFLLRAIKYKRRRLRAESSEQSRRINWTSIFSGFAVLISLVSFGLSWKQEQVGEANDRYTFWTNITKSINRQDDLEDKIKYAFSSAELINYKKFLKSNGSAVSCNLMRDMNFDNENGFLKLAGSARGIVGSYNDAVLGNEYLGNSLSISGWGAFSSQQAAVNAWWEGIMINSATLRLYAIIGSVKCRDLGPNATVHIPSAAMTQLKGAVSKIIVLAQDGLPGENAKAPNDMAYDALILANSPGLKGFFPLR